MALEENSGVRKQDGYRVVTGVSIAICNFLNSAMCDVLAR